MTRIRAEVIGAEQIARNFLRVAAELQRDLNEAARDIGEEAELIYAAHAPKGSGRLARGMSSRQAGNVVLVRADARNPESGYDYVGVTRFGHRLPRIYPTRVWARSGPPHAAALKLPWGFFRSVRGFQPKGDWAEGALPQIKTAARTRMRKLGHDIVVNLG